MNAVNVAAGVMLQTLHRRGRRPWPATPSLIRDYWRARPRAIDEAGLELAVDAMENLIALEQCSVHAASLCVARNMRNFWDDWWGRWPGSRPDDLERLNVPTLPAQLRRAFYRRHPKM